MSFNDTVLLFKRIIYKNHSSVFFVFFESALFGFVFVAGVSDSAAAGLFL